MGFPDRIERTLELAHPPATVWAALTTAEGGAYRKAFDDNIEGWASELGELAGYLDAA